MKPTPGHNIAYVFDFDDTIAKTTANIKVYRNGAFLTSLSSHDYKNFKKLPTDVLDFSEFDDGNKILNANPAKMWKVIKNISDAIKQGRSKSDIYVLTARSPIVKTYIYKFLNKHGIKIDIKNIFTVGDSQGKINISDKKLKILTDIDNQYQKVVFFDDDIKNINAIRHINTIEKRLIEMEAGIPVNFSTPMNTPGMGNAEINTSTMTGSGDNWGNIIKPKKKKRKQRKHKIVTLKEYLK